MFVPGWALGWNDDDPDVIDVLTLASVDASSGGSTLQFGSDALFIDDDATLGGSFDYTVDRRHRERHLGHRDDRQFGARLAAGRHRRR